MSLIEALQEHLRKHPDLLVGLKQEEKKREEKNADSEGKTLV